MAGTALLLTALPVTLSAIVAAPRAPAGIQIVRAQPGSYLLCKELAVLAVNAFYGDYQASQGPAIYVQRAIIEGDVLMDLQSRLRYYEEARQLQFPHVGAVYLARDERTGAACGFVDIGQTLHEGGKFTLPKRPEGDPKSVSAGSQVELRPYLSNLAVHESWRRSGVGTALVRACEAEARQWADGAHSAIWLEVSESNAGAQDFYSRLGYEQEAKTSGREILRRRWTFETAEVQRSLMRKSLRAQAGGGEERGVVVPSQLEQGGLLLE